MTTPAPTGQGELLLRDYRPQPCLIVPATAVEQPRYPVFDAHNHLGEEFGGSWDHRPLGELLEALDQSGVRVLADMDGGWGEVILQRHLRHFKEPAPERFCVFGGVDWSAWPEHRERFAEWAAGRLRLQAQWGAQGLKVWKSFGLHVRDHRGQLVAVDDARLDPIWETAAELGLPVLIHVADPVAFFRPLDAHNERWEELHAHPDWHFPSPPYPSFESIVGGLARLVERHPRTTFIGAHVGCYAENLAWVGALLERCPNLYVDIAARIAELGRQPYTARRFFLRYADRILFGTDSGPDLATYRIYYRFLETDDEYFSYSPGDLPGQGRWQIYGLHLPDEVLQKIYYQNAERVIWGSRDKGLGNPPASWPLDTEVSMTLPGCHTEQEILSQPEAWAATLQALQEQSAPVRDLLAKGGYHGVLFTGCGSTYYLALAAAASLQEVSGFPARGMPASEVWLRPDLAVPAGQRMLLVAVSRSGETTETLRACQGFQYRGLGDVLTLSCYPGRPLTTLGRWNLTFPAGQEESVAQTRAFSTLYLASVALAALWAGRGALLEELAHLPAAGRRLLDRYGDAIRSLGRDERLERFYFLGSGPRYGLAGELSLKMKEMSLSHSEPFHFLEFRHGPMSMVTPAALVVGLVSQSSRGHETAVLQQMRAMGGRTLALAEEDADVALTSGLSEAARNVLYLPAGQLLALERSRSRGLDPDRPHNLTAVVRLEEEVP